MKHYGVFDIIGPIMVGPSSSHTAGAARLGLFARHLCGESVKKAVFYMHGSFAETYAGHGTDKALLAGIRPMPVMGRTRRFWPAYRASAVTMRG